MKILKDILTGDELLSDSYDPVLVDDIVYEANCSMITLGAVNVDIGANASAEGGDDEGVDDQAVQVNNIVHSFRYQETGFDKKSFLTYLKAYMKAVRTHLQEKGTSEEEIKKFETGAQKYAKEKIIPHFKDFQFFTGESMNPDGMVVLLNYREDGNTPYVIVWRHGIEEMKV